MDTTCDCSVIRLQRPKLAEAASYQLVQFNVRQLPFQAYQASYDLHSRPLLQPLCILHLSAAADGIKKDSQA